MNMNFIVDKSKAMKKWAPILDTLNVQDNDKREWMSEYAEMHQMNENVAYSTLYNLNGMGAVQSPTVGTTPGSVWQSGSGAVGSGDVAQNLLPVSMKIAAQTIGLDLVAVKPTASPRIELLFVDFKYDNNDNDSDDRPLVFKVGSDTTADITTLKVALNAQLSAQSIQERIGGLDSRTFVKIGNGTATPSEIVAFTGSASDTKTGWLEFLGFSRVDGYPMFRSFRQMYPVMDGNFANDEWNADKNTFAQTDSIANILLSGITVLSGNTSTTGSTSTLTGDLDIELVSLMEDHIPGFSAGWKLYNPMTRAEDEKTYPGVIGPDIFTKSIQVGDIEITSALKRTQIEDIKAATGMDIVQKLEGVLINELTQVISKEIVASVRELALKNRASHTAPKDGSGNSKFDFDVDTYLTLPATTSSAFAAPGGETYHSMQRKLISKINNASNFIATDGRVGPAQYLVTNGNLASVIQDIAGYTINPVQAGKMNTNGQLYPMGNIGNISVYVDPYMRWDDNQIFLGRKNSVDQPGLVFIPYLMAQSISLISEATWAPRMLIRSRYVVSDIGFFPEKQFMAINVTDSNSVLI